ncbi:MAG: protein phosphatase CheZ [Chlorobi bacterium]|jgi:chemotaxis protein CheZ|nr:protein phosphatase CheZ [Chlorobiota bacterium]
MNDSPELEALFDDVYRQVHSDGKSTDNGRTSECPSDCIPEPYYSQLGQLLRHLHTTLTELGYDRSIEYAVGDALPDTVERLDYVRRVTAEAATKVLDATDAIKPIYQHIRSDVEQLGMMWRACLEGKLSVDEFKQLAQRTTDFFHAAPQSLDTLHDYINKIIMAQDFQDRTNQVLSRAIELTKTVESELLKLLVNGIPPTRKASVESSLLNGPVVNPEREGDVVVSQEQVDALLESLGF